MYATHNFPIINNWPQCGPLLVLTELIFYIYIYIYLLIKLHSSFRLLSVSSVAQSCPTLCDTMNCSTLGLPVHHQHSELTQTHVH